MVERLVSSVLVGLFAGFLTWVVLTLLTVAAHPWAVLVGVLCAVGFFFSRKSLF